MRFKQWLAEAGHLRVDKPQDITVMLGKKPTVMHGVTMIDPKFEDQEIPPPPDVPSKAKKFLGQSPFSLPLVGPDGTPTWWLVSDDRMSMMNGNGHLSHEPVGVRCPPDWADHAIILGQDYQDLKAGPQPLAAS